MKVGALELPGGARRPESLIPVSTPKLLLPGRSEALHWAVLWSLIGLSILHIVAAWGYTSLYWGDQGRWLHEVERFASGETLYRDYYWPFPPLAMWIIGGAARVLGSSLAVVWSMTAAIYLLIAVAYFRYVSLLVQRPLVPFVAIAGFVLATAYANQASAPLPTGMYTPAAPIGFLLLLTATILVLEMVEKATAIRVAVLGLLCGLCILTKHDFWLPALYLVLAGVVLCGLVNTSHRWLAGLLAAMFAGIVLAGAVVVGEQSGWGMIGGVLAGFGQIKEAGGNGLPTWERLTVQVAAVSATTFVVTTCFVAARAVTLSRSRRLLTLCAAGALLAFGLHVYMSLRVGRSLQMTGIPAFLTPTEDVLAPHVLDGTSLLRPALGSFRQRVEHSLLGILVPLGLLAIIAARWRHVRSEALRNTVIVLLILCLAARARRGFAFVEWFHVLLEVPVYVLSAQLLFDSAGARVDRAIRIALVLLLVLGVYSYWDLGRGPLTRRGALKRVETARGTVHWTEANANSYRWLNDLLQRLDPSGQRPLFAFGYTGGFNYFLDRRNPTPATQGFRFAAASPAAILTVLRAQNPAPFLLDNPAPYEHLPGAVPALELRRWESRYAATPYLRDRPYFEAAVASCDRSRPHYPGPGRMVVYDCAGQVFPRP